LLRARFADQAKRSHLFTIAQASHQEHRQKNTNTNNEDYPSILDTPQMQNESNAEQPTSNTPDEKK